MAVKLSIPEKGVLSLGRTVRRVLVQRVGRKNKKGLRLKRKVSLKPKGRSEKGEENTIT